MNYPHIPLGQQPQVRKAIGKELSLISLVEQYLADNNNLSYINIDDMIDCLQNKSFRYARMKRLVFANMVRKSYFDYCQRNQGVDLIPQQGQPDARDEAADSDSDVEIQEEYQPRNDLVSSHLTSLYSSSITGRKSLPSTFNTRQDRNHAGNIPSVLTNTRESKGSPESTSSESLLITSSNNNVNNEQLLGNVDDVRAFAKLPSDTANDSDNDLEIIEEVMGDGVIRQTNGIIPVGIGNPGENCNTSINGSAGVSNLKESFVTSRDLVSSTSLPVVDVLPRVVKSSNTETKRIKAILAGSNVTITSVVSSEPKNSRTPVSTLIKEKPKKVEIESQTQARGTKRKAPLSQGLNEDMTPKKLKKEISVVQDSGYRLSDFAGSEKVVEEVCRLLMHLKHPEVYKTLGVTAPRGFLLHGPPGTGKTLLANALAGELQLPMLKVTGTEFISGISGESESNIRDLFNQAVAIAPCIIFIDEIDSITPKRENAQREMERRVVAQLLSCVDDLMNHEKGSQVLLIGATNRIEAIDSALRRAGRFDREICLGIPDEKSRAKILAVICRNLRLAPGFDLNLLAKFTPGYVGADLSALVREAAVQAVNKALMESDRTRNNIDAQKIQSHPIFTSYDNGIDKTLNEEVTVLETASDDSKTDKFSKLVTKSVEVEAADTSEKESANTTSIKAADELIEEQQSKPGQTISETTSENVHRSVEELMEVDATGVLDTSTVTGTGVVEQETSKTSDEPTKVSLTATTSNIPVEQETSKTSGEPTRVPSTVTTSDIPVDQDDLEKKPDPDQGAEQEEPSHLRWIRETAPLSKNELDELYIFMDDFEIALKYVQPSSKREGFATVPDTTWDDIGALKDIREELEVSILGPVKHSSAFQMLGLNTPAGVLLCGPPGCGKTLLAKAVANEAGINFISVKGPELLNMYVGESERAVRQCFLRAKNSSPCVIFFDELDALCPRRSDNPESGSGSRIVNQLLTEMDGMESRAGVFVMAATNRPDIIDPAILRPGRLDKILFVDLPTAADRFEILKAITKEGTRPIIDSDVNMKEISERQACDNYTGADLAALVREASIAAFRDLVLNSAGTSGCPDKDLKVSARHFETAFLKTKPSVTKKDRQKYSEMKEKYSVLGER